MPTKSNQKKLLPVIKLRNKYYTRIRWGSDNTGRGHVCFPLSTETKSVAEHRRDIISTTSLRSKIIRAYEDNGTDGVQRIKDEIDWCRKGGTLVEMAFKVTDAIEQYDEYLISQRLNPKTIEIYMRSLNEFVCKTNVKYADKINQRHITIFKKGMPELSKHTVNSKLRALQTFFNWMLDDGYLENPIRVKKLPSINPPINFFSDKDFEKILDNVKKGFPHAEAKMDDDDRELFLNAYWLYWNTGMRLSEPFNNALEMDEDGYRVKIIGSTTKNSYLRYVHLTDHQGLTVIQMNDWLERQLKTRKSRYGTIKVFSKVFAKALKKSNIKGKFHDLRKSFATRLYFYTGEEFTLCHALGHTDTSMTKQYTNVDKVILGKAYPNIYAMKNAQINGKKVPRAYNQGQTKLYSNFGFMWGSI